MAKVSLSTLPDPECKPLDSDRLLGPGSARSQGYTLEQARRQVQLLSLTWSVFVMSTATVVIPESYPLLRDMGHGACASGWLIGCSWALQALSVSVLKPIWGGLEHASKKACIVFAGFVFSLSTLGYAVAADPPAALQITDATRLVGVIGSRLLAGPCTAVGLFLVTLSLEVTTNAEMVRFSVLRSCSLTVGVGWGPLLSGLADFMLQADGVRERAAAPAWFLAVGWGMFAAMLFWMLPADPEPLLQAKQDEDTYAKAEVGSPQSVANSRVEKLSSDARLNLWSSGVYYGVERAFIVSALEAATTFVLQTEFGWSTQGAAFAVGITFLGSIPITVVANCAKTNGWVSDVSLMQASAVVCALSSALLFPQLTSYLGDSAVGAAAVLVADGMIFSTGYLANGVLDGLACQSSMPGTRYTAENYTLLGQILQNTLARLVAPVLARVVLDQSGRGAYATFQLSISALGCLTCCKATGMLSYGQEESKEPDSLTNIMQGIGKTPMLSTVLAERLGVPGTLSVKLEGFNPAGSVKDRCAEYMVRMAEKRGVLVPFSHQHVVESSSGSLAKGLAMVCAQRGYKFTAVCDKFSATKNVMAEAFGAEVVVVEGPPDADQVALRNLRRAWCRKMCEEDPYAVHLDQYINEDSHMSYYHSLAPEIYAQCPDLDVLMIATGTGGQLRGCSLYFSETAPYVKIMACEGTGSTIFADPSTRRQREISDGTGYHCALPRVERCLEEGTVKEIYIVEEEDSILTSTVIARTDGALVGPSGGMAIFAALCHMSCAAKVKGAQVRAVVVCPDRLDPYKAQMDEYIKRHMGTGLSTEELIERLRIRIADVAGQCTLGQGMIDPRILAFRRPPSSRRGR